MSDSEEYNERVLKVHCWWYWNLRVVQRDTMREFQRYTVSGVGMYEWFRGIQ